MGNLKAPPGPNAVHLCLDMQKLFSPAGPWPTPWLERVLPVVVQLVAHCPERCVFTRFIPPQQPEQMPGTWQHYYQKWRKVTRAVLEPDLLELLPPLARFVPPAAVFDKAVYSAFAGGGLHQWLSERSVDTLIVTGSETDICVLSTVLAAVDHGYRIIVVQDAICSSSDLTHDALLTLYNTRFDLQIEMATAEQLLACW